MRSSAIVLGFAALAAGAALPAPQSFDFSMYKVLDSIVPAGAPVGGGQQEPTPVPTASKLAAASAVGVSAAAAAASDAPAARMVKRAPACSPNAQGSAPVTSPDTPQAFANNQVYIQMGGSATTTPGYSLTFQNLHGATQQNGYLGYYTLTSYNTVFCQQKCDAADGCVAFNIYIERDPSVVPGAGCANPPSTVNYKCSLYSLPISSTTATNTGQYQADFQVLITASNGYTKYPPPPPQAGFTGPVAFGGAIESTDGSYLTMSFFAGGYDVSQCAAACQAITNFNRQQSTNGTYQSCNFFNAYLISKNGAAQGTQCSYYTRSFGKSASTNYGQYDQDGNYYSVSQSYGYTASA